MALAHAIQETTGCVRSSGAPQPVGVGMGDWGVAAAAAAGVALTSLASVVVARINRKPAEAAATAAESSADAQVQQAISAGFKILADQMHTEIGRANVKIDGLSRSVDTLTGHVRDLSQHIVSLEKILRDHDIDVPERPVVALVMPFDPPADAGIVSLNQSRRPR